ncbi:MAG TPA: DUF4920 domain-containing protein, partial [Chitinophagaceae bacterium]
MKKILSLFVFSMMVAAGNAQPPDVPADKGATFGAGATADNAITVDAMISQVTGNEGKKTEVKLIGEVVEVCQEKGCWMK